MIKILQDLKFNAIEELIRDEINKVKKNNTLECNYNKQVLQKEKDGNKASKD